MIKCCFPGCAVVVAPDRGDDLMWRQKGAFMHHLAGTGKSVVVGNSGHGLSWTEAREVAELVIDGDDERARQFCEAWLEKKKK